jgi:hypothetical protein
MARHFPSNGASLISRTSPPRESFWRYARFVVPLADASG